VRFAGAALLVVGGAATALATVLLHQVWWGLLLSVAATVAALVALGRGWLTRLPFALGWVGLAAAVTPQRPEGDYLVGSNTSGYLLLGFALLVLLFAVVTLPRPRRGTPGDVGDDF
jgi:hypothetical protein